MHRIKKKLNIFHLLNYKLIGFNIVVVLFSLLLFEIASLLLLPTHEREPPFINFNLLSGRTENYGLKQYKGVELDPLVGWMEGESLKNYRSWIRRKKKKSSSALFIYLKNAKGEKYTSLEEKITEVSGSDELFDVFSISLYEKQIGHAFLLFLRMIKEYRPNLVVLVSSFEPSEKSTRKYHFDHPRKFDKHNFLRINRQYSLWFPNMVKFLSDKLGMRHGFVSFTRGFDSKKSPKDKWIQVNRWFVYVCRSIGTRYFSIVDRDDSSGEQYRELINYLSEFKRR